MTPTQRAAMEQALETFVDIKYRLEKARTWGGMIWTYHPIHPRHYLHAREKARGQIEALRAALAENQLDDINVVDMAEPADQSCYCPNCESLGRELAEMKRAAAEQEPVACVACEGHPQGENNPCEVCRLTAPQPAKREPVAWTPVAEAMPKSGVIVLAYYTNVLGEPRRIRAQWVAAQTQEADCESENCEYDEGTDTYWTPEGWYECIDNWDEYSSVFVSEKITHWMPLPPGPDEAAIWSKT
jgi:hypothetical protein